LAAAAGLPCKKLTYSPFLFKKSDNLRYWAFNATNVLLYTATQRLRNACFVEVNSLLTNANVCMDVLRACGIDEPIALRFLNLVESSYDTLRQLECSLLAQQADRNRSSQKMGIHNLLQDNSPVSPVANKDGLDLTGTPAGNELDALTSRIANVLKDPYGRLQPEEQTQFSSLVSLSPQNDVHYWFT
jgi:hypothetical protein